MSLRGKKPSIIPDYPNTHKRCMTCGEIIPWESDCSLGHFAQIGRELRYKAGQVYKVRKTKSKVQKEATELPLFGE